MSSVGPLTRPSPPPNQTRVGLCPVIGGIFVCESHERCSSCSHKSGWFVRKGGNTSVRYASPRG
jgi:hypothetical protein